MRGTARCLLTATLVVLCTALGGGFSAAPALAAGTGTATMVVVTPNPITIVADGTSMTTVTATVTDSSSAPVTGDSIVFSDAADPAVGFTATVDNGDGTYTATLTSSTVAGSTTITATDTTSNNVSGQATLNQSPGPVTTVALSLSPASIPADGTTTSTATATVTDAHGNSVPGETITFTHTGTAVTVGSTIDHGNGTYTAKLKSTTVGSSVITAHDVPAGVASPPMTLSETAGSVASVALSLSPGSIVADGTSTSTATVTVTDSSGNPVPGETITLTHTGTAVTIGQVADNGNGTYTAAITSTKSGSSTITAHDSAAGVASLPMTLTETPGPATRIQSVVLNPTSIVASGTSMSTATAKVVDAHGNGVPGETISFTSSDAGITFSSVTDNGDGTYTTTLTSSTTQGRPAIIATDAAAGASGQAFLTETAGNGASVALVISPVSITANGTSTTTATATVTDVNGNPVQGDPITFSSNDPGIKFAPAQITTNNSGVARTTVTSSTTAGFPTITASDSASGTSAQAILVQTPGPAANVAVALSPPSIVANGSSTSTATATVTDLNGNRVGGDTITFSSTDAGNGFNPASTSTSSNGVYSTTVTSSTTIGNPTISATDASTNATGGATLTQTSPQQPGSTTTLGAVPNATVTNQGTTLIATVTSSAASPAGTVEFENRGAPIGGCASQPLAASGPSGTVTCLTSFSAATSPEQLTAVFTPSPGSNLTGSSSASHTLVVSRDASSTALQAPSGQVKVGAKVTYLATVRSAHGGAAGPAGTVAFQNGAKPISACAKQPLVGGTATCTLSYRTTGTENISAVYGGDGNFSGSGSTPPQSFPVVALGRINSTMQWTFFFSPTYTRVLQLVVNTAPVGSTVIIQCHGTGCPFSKRSTVVTTTKCPRKSAHPPKSGHSCHTQRSQTLNLQPSLRGRHLRVGTKFTIMIVRFGYVGKYYGFVVRPRHLPRVQIACLAPGGTRPNAGC